MSLNGGLADKALFSKSIRGEDDLDKNSVAINKQVNFISDSNNSSYNGQIIFDTGPLLNNNKYIPASEMYLQIPFNFNIKNTGSNSTAAVCNSFSLGLKNGYYQLINSIQVDVNGSTLVSAQPYTNMYINSKIMLTWNNSTQQLQGPSIGFWPDTTGSASFNAASNVNGDGYSNNVQLPTSFAGEYNYASLSTYNARFYERQERTTAYDPLNGTNGITNTNTASQCNSVGQSYFIKGSAATAGTVLGTWYVLATIRLSDISDLFEQMPLSKIGQMRIYINYNQVSTVITSAATSAGMVLASGSTLSYGLTNPIMVSSAATGSAGAPLLSSTGTTLTIQSGIATTSINGVSSSPILNTCRLYVPSYDLTPHFINEYTILQNPIKTVRYNDIFTYPILNIASTATFNNIITNGLPNLKYIMILPYNNGSSGVFANITSSVITSPFDTAPGTLSSPYLSLQQLQITVANENMWQTPQSYGFSHFQDEISQLGLDGGIDNEMTSGLLNQASWFQNNAIIICDISRRLPQDDNVPKSVTISGQNNTTNAVDLICICVYSKKFDLDVRSGEIFT